ncbi:pyrroline-5-carboxylate reductase [Cellulomonas marina]|uniref:Pyrroline-5-carboxylate reductase n=1 Tax=Cellulomonas marina TaxID=988821 RepID=A0A1I0XHA4_9CELL|nr:pyrroline-5-carboxylate reductase [Cellulomonas marina]GIG30714.1 pyrroline-5-carboxylate reductase [Cellulomonas marina]SFB00405.1 pyrroline-5-carboxylate reductase [Cellulomonas marina]
MTQDESATPEAGTTAGAGTTPDAGPSAAAPGPVAVVGGGVMGATLVGAVLAGGLAPGDVRVAERSAARVAELVAAHGVQGTADNVAAVTDAAVVLLAVKPDVVAPVLDEIAPHLAPGALVVSVAAGVPLAAYESRLPAGTPVVRVMPNTPALIGRGASAIAAGTAAGERHLALAERLLAATGLVVRVAEKDLDAVTAISGSGPAYAFYVIDAMAEAGVLLGLPRDLATRLAVATVEGSAALVRESGDHPVVLRERVSSPGGTTVAAVRQLDVHGVRAGVLAAAEAARDRSRALGAAYGA